MDNREQNILEEGKVVERVLFLISSPDKEMVRLGITIALNMGAQWCIDNLMNKTICSTNNIKMRHVWPFMILNIYLERSDVYIKDDIAIVLQPPGKIYCIYEYQICQVVPFYRDNHHFNKL